MRRLAHYVPARSSGYAFCGVPLSQVADSYPDAICPICKVAAYEHNEQRIERSVRTSKADRLTTVTND